MPIPLMAGEIASPAELSEFADAAPNAARATQRLYAAWRESLERLSDLSHRMTSAGDGVAEIPGRLPGATAAAWFEQAGAWFPEIESAAEDLSANFSRRDDPGQALRAHLRDAFGIDVRILPRHVMPVEQARYDRHSQRLFLSESVPSPERPFLLARQAALSGFRDLLDRSVAAAGLADAEAARICRWIRQPARAAILAPAGRLAEAAREPGSDVVRLGERFGLRPIRVMVRLAAPAPRAAVSRLLSDCPRRFGRRAFAHPGSGIPLPALRSVLCPAAAFRCAPGRPAAGHGARCFRTIPPSPRSQLAEEGISFARAAIAAAVSPPRLAARRGERPHSGLAGAPIRPIGVTCRLCERAECAHRLYPTVTRPAAFQEHVVGPSDYELLS